ncbi:MAG TPA: STAS domain-containing protein [Terriglobales bacterium]|nr:STAS domain-containing protein [Terriglobales bacterium]
MRTLEIVSRPGLFAGQTVLELNGSLELQQVFAFQNKMREDQSPVVILDMTNIAYIDSAGIGALVNAKVSRMRSGRRLAIAGITDRAKTVLDVTKTAQFFDFYPTAAEAEAKVLPSSETATA